MDYEKSLYENKQKGAFWGANQDFIQEGLSKREYFACAAMQGLLANSEGSVLTSSIHSQMVHDDPKAVASASLDYADELLKLLEEEK